MAGNGQKKIYTIGQLNQIPGIKKLSAKKRFEMKVVARVLPFRTNNYIVENLIDWSRVPDDPIYRLNFMHHDMLESADFQKVAEVLKNGAPEKEIQKLVCQIQLKLNPHPAGQLTLNVPELEGKVVPGVQHKYRETCLVFPAQGQTCFAYCTFCFRWPQFVQLDNYKFSTNHHHLYMKYIKKHRELTDVLVTGGDPMVMSAKNLEECLLPFLKKEFDHIQTIRIGTKVLGHWPYRFLTDPDADQILALFEKIVASGKHLAFMSHFTHPRELSTKAVKKAVQKVRSTGAVIRTQSPVVKHINDSADVWTEMWQSQVQMGMIPYYMFVERDTGAQRYFEIPLIKSLDIYKQAIERVSGIARTVRGPSMSAFPGKVCVEGTTQINGEKVFVLTFLQGRNPNWIKQPFFAKYDPKAFWLDDLKPALGQKKFFYEEELNKMGRAIKKKETLKSQGG